MMTEQAEPVKMYAVVVRVEVYVHVYSVNVFFDREAAIARYQDLLEEPGDKGDTIQVLGPFGQDADALAAKVLFETRY